MQSLRIREILTKTAPLLDSRSHSLTLVQARIHLIHFRVKLTALITAVLMTAWIPLDIAFMPWTNSIKVIILARLLSTAALLLLMFYRPRSLSSFIASLQLALLLTVPLLFFFYTNEQLQGQLWTENNIFVKSSYAHFPILIAMLLSLFPLTAKEGALLGGSIIGVAALVANGDLTPAHMLFGHGTIWVLFVVTGLAIISGMSQLYFMAGFVEYSTRDEMTECLKRDYGLVLLDALFAVAERKKSPFCILFFDLDHFKRVNDTFGHDKGDDVLKEAGRRLRSALRRQDAIVRWGGEEFVAALPNTTMKDIMPIFERLKAQGLGILPDGVIQTASVGVAEYLEDGLKSSQEIISLADKRMYEAKKGGRNTVMIKDRSFPFAPLLV